MVPGILRTKRLSVWALASLGLLLMYQNCGDRRMGPQGSPSTSCSGCGMLSPMEVTGVSVSSDQGLPNQLLAKISNQEGVPTEIQFLPLYQNTQCTSQIQLTLQDRQELAAAISAVVLTRPMPAPDICTAIQPLAYEVFELTTGGELSVTGQCADLRYLAGQQQLRCAVKAILDRHDLGNCQSIWNQGTTPLGCSQ